MSSFTESGYDGNVSIYSPDGRIYQIEYAQHATHRGATAIGLRGNDGIVFAAENLVLSPLYEPRSSSHTFTVSPEVGAVTAGYMPDGKHIINIARAEAREFKLSFKMPIPVPCLKQRVSMYVQVHTQYGGLRPFGASVIMGGYDTDGCHLYSIDPSGNSLGYLGGCAIGNAKEVARSEMDDIDFQGKSIVELVNDAAKIIYTVHDDSKNFELELSWIGEVTKGKHVRVPFHVHSSAEEYAKQMIDDSDFGSEQYI